MGHRYWQVYTHLVWCTENRSNILRGELEKAAHAAMREVVRELDMVPVCINSAWNHTHALISWNPSISIETAVEQMKEKAVNSWEEAKQDGDEQALRWQQGWAAFSVSPKLVDHVKWYIVNQKSLHRSGKIIERFEALKGES